jgi:citrate synthase
METMPQPDPQADFAALAKPVAAAYTSQKKIIPGIGHPIHKPIDPRTPRLLQLAAETGFDGPYLKLMLAIAKEAEAQSGRILPVNATGAIGALCCEMGFDWQICRGLGVMARAVGLVGHILEESRNPMGAQIWHTIEAQASAHMRPKASPTVPDAAKE